MSDNEKFTKVLQIFNDQNNTISGLKISLELDEFNLFIYNIKHIFKYFILHINNIDKCYEVYDLLNIWYSKQNSNIILNILFKFRPNNKKPEEYVCINYILDLLTKFKHKFIECTYSTNDKPKYINHLFNTRKDYMTIM